MPKKSKIKYNRKSKRKQRTKKNGRTKKRKISKMKGGMNEVLKEGIYAIPKINTFEYLKQNEKEKFIKLLREYSISMKTKSNTELTEKEFNELINSFLEKLKKNVYFFGCIPKEKKAEMSQILKLEDINKKKLFTINQDFFYKNLKEKTKKYVLELLQIRRESSYCIEKLKKLIKMLIVFSNLIEISISINNREEVKIQFPADFYFNLIKERCKKNSITKNCRLSDIQFFLSTEQEISSFKELLNKKKK
jgi:ABC-type multidrug transport system fused ATPase/permease subunit